jgi:hypothetical protein
VQEKCKRVVGEEGVSEDTGQKPDLEAARQASSISEALKRLGFYPVQTKGCFIRGQVAIPFTALAGHTVASFLKWLEDRGYISTEELA